MLFPKIPPGLFQNHQTLANIHKYLIISLLPTTILLLPLGGLAFAQAPQLLDSLNRLLATSKPDTNRVNILLNLSYASIHADTAIAYAQKAITLARKFHFTRAEFNALTTIAYIERDKLNYVAAIRYAQQALQVATQGKQLPEQGGCLSDLGRYVCLSELYRRST